MRTEIGDPGGRMDPSTYPYVTVTWHNRLLFFPAMFPKHARTRTTALISASRDGQYVADLVKRFGIESVRGSSSRRGAMALDGAIKHLERGRNVSGTPDGPRGPRYAVQPGIVKLAQSSGAPIVAVHATYENAWRARTWDGFAVPKPFSRVTVTFDEAIAVPRRLDDDAFEQWRKKIESLLRSGVDDLDFEPKKKKSENKQPK
jgi:lysophospholipid acyltransferase (LPLAT)-like uncharacterized protein